MGSMFSQVAKDAIKNTFMTDVVSIFPSPSRVKGTMAADFTTTYTDDTARALNEPAHIEPLVGRRQSELGKADTTIGELAVKIQPQAVADVRPGDHVRVITAADPLLSGAVLVVVRAEPRSSGLSTRLICRRPEAAAAPGAS